MAKFSKDGMVQSVVVRKTNSSRELKVRAKQVINAAGPWADQILKLDRSDATSILLPSKGTHIFFEKSRLGLEKGLLLFHPSDHRVFFLLPWNEKILVGTTDTNFPGNPDEVQPEKEDIDYLVEGVSHYFPNAGINATQITGSIAGLRPLLRQNKNSSYRVSREHAILETPSGILTIAGGKYTTFRRMAEEVVDRAAKMLKAKGYANPIGPCITANKILD